MSRYGGGPSGAPQARRPRQCALPGCDEKWAHLRCAECKAVFYCCREHQRAHWRAGHRDECGLIAVANAERRDDATVRARATTLGAAAREALVAGARESPLDEGSAHRMDKAGLLGKLRAQEATISELDRRIRLIRARLGEPSPTASLAAPYDVDAAADASSAASRAIRTLPQPALAPLLEETVALRALARRACEEIKRDLNASGAWDLVESGFETRDVLENGERRAHMEARVGRAVTLEDVRGEMARPAHERRARMLEGIAIDGGPLPGPLDAATLDFAAPPPAHQPLRLAP